jgi:hypothetical protein
MRIRLTIPARRTIFLGLVLAAAGYYLYLTAVTGMAQPLRIVSTSVDGSEVRAGDLILVRSPDKSPIRADDVVLVNHPSWPTAPALLRVDAVQTDGNDIVVALTEGQTLRAFPTEAVTATLVARVPVAGMALEWLVLFGTRLAPFVIAVVLFLRFARAMEATPRPAFLRLGLRWPERF